MGRGWTLMDRVAWVGAAPLKPAAAREGSPKGSPLLASPSQPSQREVGLVWTDGDVLCDVGGVAPLKPTVEKIAAPDMSASVSMRMRRGVSQAK